MTDDDLGVSGTQYSQSDNYRGLELDTQPFEQFTLSPDMKTLSFQFRTTNVLDEVRIITVVEPASLLVLGAGLTALSMRRRRKG